MFLITYSRSLYVVLSMCLSSSNRSPPAEQTTGWTTQNLSLFTYIYGGKWLVPLVHLVAFSVGEKETICALFAVNLSVRSSFPIWSRRNKNHVSQIASLPLSTKSTAVYYQDCPNIALFFNSIFSILLSSPESRPITQLWKLRLVGHKNIWQISSICYIGFSIITFMN